MNAPVYPSLKNTGICVDLCWTREQQLRWDETQGMTMQYHAFNPMSCYLHVPPQGQQKWLTFSRNCPLFHGVDTSGQFRSPVPVPRDEHFLGPPTSKSLFGHRGRQFLCHGRFKLLQASEPGGRWSFLCLTLKLG